MPLHSSHLLNAAGPACVRFHGVAPDRVYSDEQFPVIGRALISAFPPLPRRYKIHITPQDYIHELEEKDCTLVLNLEPVTVSGDIRFTTESRPGSAKDALGQSGLSFDGFIGGDSYGSIRGALTSLELLDAEGNDLTQAAPGVYQVEQLELRGLDQSSYRNAVGDLQIPPDGILALERIELELRRP